MEMLDARRSGVHTSAIHPRNRFVPQFVGVFKKNVLLKLGAKKQLAYEMLYPVYFSVILYLIARPMQASADFPGSCDGTRSQGQCTQAASPLNPAPPGICGHSNVSSSVLLYSPNTPEAEAVISDVLRLLRSTSSCALGFDTPKKAEAWYTAEGSQNTPLSPGRPAIVAGAVYLPTGFETQGTISYKLALPPTNFDWCAVFCPDTPRTLAEAPLSESRDYFADSAMRWATPLSMQWAVTRAIAMSRNETLRSMVLGEGDTSAMPLPPLLAKLPVPAIYSAYPPSSHETLQYLFPLYTCWGLTAAIGYVVAMVVNEREKKLLDGLKMMGLNPLVSTLGWWAVYVLIFTLGASAITIVAAMASLFPGADMLLFWLTMELYMLSMLAACFVVANVMSTAKPSQGVATLFYMGSFGLYALNVAIGRPLLLERFLCLIPFVAGPVGVLNFLDGSFAGVPLTSSRLTVGQTPLLAVWGYLLFDAGLMVALAWYVEQVRFGGRSPLFVCSKAFWWPSRLSSDDSPPSSLRASRGSSDEAAVSVVDSEPSLPAAVVMTRLSRSFPGSPPVVALTEVTLTLYEGHVTALLGQNGAGKSTAIGILTGLFPPTSGRATVFGMSVTRRMDAIRAVTGVCPQHDLLYDTLTCREHLELLSAIKGAPLDGERADVHGWLQQVGLADKLGARSSTLSGGQKRKLSVAMAMIGSPRFVLLDEPTAGMDPESRRGIWDVISRARASRSILLTSHFMDEADALADRIAILCKPGGDASLGGTLRVVDTSLALKTRWGAGYTLTLALDQEHDAPALLRLIQSHVAGAQQTALRPREMSAVLPQEQSASYAALFDALGEGKRRELGVLSFGISLPSLQEVFLKIVDELVEPVDTQLADPSAVAIADGGGGGSTEAPTSELVPSAVQPSDVEVAMGASAPPSHASMLGTALWINRATFRSELPYITYTIAFALLMVAFILPVSLSDGADDTRPVFDASARALASAPALGRWFPYNALKGSAAYRGLEAVSAADGLTPHWLGDPPSGSNLSQLVDSFQRRVATSAKLAGNAMGGVSPVDADDGGQALWSHGSALLYDSNFTNAPPVLLSMLDSALLSKVMPGLAVEPSYTLLPINVTAAGPSFSGVTVVKLMLTPLLFSVSAILFTIPAVYDVVSTRETKCKHQLLLMGMDVTIYWLGVFLTHGALLLTFLALPAIVAAGAAGTLSAAAMPAFAITSIVSLPAILLFGFVLSFVFETRKAAASFYMITNLLLSTATNIIIGSATNEDTRMLFQRIALIVPLNQLTGAVSTCLQIDLSAAILQQAGKTPPGPAGYFTLRFTNDWNDSETVGPGACMLASALSILVYGLLIFQLDLLVFLRPSRSLLPARALTGGPRTDDENEDVDVTNERRRIEGDGEAPPSERGWVVLHGLRKEWHRSCSRLRPSSRAVSDASSVTVAVESLSLGIAPGTCFALLGPNGAGKTTAISMLTGATFPTAGDAWVRGLSVRTRLTAIFKLTGFCPQFQGLWEKLTLRQHLVAYMRIKGVPFERLAGAAAGVEAEYGLTEHSSKQTRALSGGTRRKLSAAIAMACGKPDVVFLDEPTTGVDVGTRRFIWDRIQSSIGGRVILLTTHYMDEADALAHRIGIMALGKLRVLGSPQHLKSTHGGGYRVQVSGPAAKAEAVAQMVADTFEEAHLLEAHGGAQSFEVSASFDLATAFRTLERAKQDGDVHSYSLSQTTLEQVFLNIAARSTTSEE